MSHVSVNKVDDENPKNTSNKQPLLREASAGDLVQVVSKKEPERVKCPHCGFNGMSITKGKLTTCGAVACLLLLPCCLCCIPIMCIKSCRKTIHTCQACHLVMGEVWSEFTRTKIDTDSSRVVIFGKAWELASLS